jgi:hypothetical protein
MCVARSSCLQVVLDERGAAALSRLLEGTPTLQQLELCRYTCFATELITLLAVGKKDS